MEHLKPYLVPEMQRIYKLHNPGYMASQRHDYRPLYDIACFIAGMLNVGDRPERRVPEILEMWTVLAKTVSTHPFWAQKSLASISNHIQEIATIARDGDSRQPKKVNANDLQEAINRRYGGQGPDSNR